MHLPAASSPEWLRLVPSLNIACGSTPYIGVQFTGCSVLLLIRLRLCKNNIQPVGMIFDVSKPDDIATKGNKFSAILRQYSITHNLREPGPSGLCGILLPASVYRRAKSSSSSSENPEVTKPP